MELFVETLSPTDMDETGFTAHGRAKHWWDVAFDWASSRALLPGIENEVENQAHHIEADIDYWDEDGVKYFSARIESGGGRIFYRAFIYQGTPE